MAYTLTHEKSFSRQITEACHKPSLAALALFLIYTFLFVQHGSITTTFVTLLLTLGISFLTYALVSYVCLPYSYTLLTGGITRNLEQKEEMTDLERTKLAGKIMSLPIKLCYVMVFWMMVFAIVLSICFVELLQMAVIRAVCILVPYFFASFFSSLMVYTRAEAVCTEETQQLMVMGIDPEMVRKHPVLGMRLNLRLFYHVILPVSCSLAILGLYCYLDYPRDNSSSLYIFNAAVLAAVSLLECVIVANSFKTHTVEEVVEVNDILETVASGNVDSVLQLPVDLGTELSYTFWCINQLMITLQQRRVFVRGKIRILSDTLDSLANAHQKTMALHTANSATFQKMTQLQQQVQDSFAELQQQQINTDALGNRILSFIDTGRMLMADNTTQLESISQANIETITGIKKVSDQIDSVWRYISIIDDIAEKNRTIAFNTEIESTATGENAENFHIIAAEIRRLASSITESTREIRNRITDIQHSTDNLIITSEGGTEKIREESNLFGSVENSFEALILSGKITDESYEAVSGYIQQELELEKDLVTAYSLYSSCCNQFLQMMDSVGSAVALSQMLVQEEIHD